MRKNEIRHFYLKKRNALSFDYCKNSDQNIFDKLINQSDYLTSDLILIYVSVGSEIDTSKIINHSFKTGKRVAVPYCKKGRMDFYEIKSTDELVSEQFGIPTVETDGRTPVTITVNTLCIVPALCIDSLGNRLGYGGGYYDRFLSENAVRHVCLVRSDFIIDNIPFEDYDFKIQKFITD